MYIYNEIEKETERRRERENHTIEADLHIEGLAQHCSNSIANALELLQFCTKPSICSLAIQVIYSPYAFLRMIMFTRIHMLTKAWQMFKILSGDNGSGSAGDYDELIEKE